MKPIIVPDKDIEIAPVLLDLGERFGVSISYELARFICEVITYRNDNETYQVHVRFLKPGKLGDKDREWCYASCVYLIESKAERLRNETAMAIEKFIFDYKYRNWERNSGTPYRRFKGVLTRGWDRAYFFFCRNTGKLGRYLSDSSKSD